MTAREKLWELVELSAQYQSLYEAAMNSGEATQEDLDIIGIEAAETFREKIDSFLQEYVLKEEVKVEEIKPVAFLQGSKYEW